MMRPARIASLLVAFYLLTSAATASAECAWVLWLRTKSSADPMQSFQSLNECNKAMHDDPMKAAIAEGERRSITVFPSCLPDTIDPRGAAAVRQPAFSPGSPFLGPQGDLVCAPTRRSRRPGPTSVVIV